MSDREAAAAAEHERSLEFEKTLEGFVPLRQRPENVLAFLRAPEQVNPETQAIAKMVQAEKALTLDVEVYTKACTAAVITETALGRRLNPTEDWLVKVGVALALLG